MFCKDGSYHILFTRRTDKVKRHKGEGDYAFSKEHGAFDLSQAAQGIVSVFLAAADTLQTPGPYVGELQVTFPGPPPATVEKSADLALTIERAVAT